MEIGNFIHLEDGLGTVNGLIVSMPSHDIIEMHPFNFFEKSKLVNPSKLVTPSNLVNPDVNITINLTRLVKVIETYETFDELIAAHFEEFL